MVNPKLPLTEYLKVQSVTEAEIRQLMTDTSKEAGRMLRTAKGPRAAQIKLARQQVGLWATVGDLTKVGIGDATDAAALVQSAFDEDLFRKLGINTRYWSMSMLAQARAGIDSYISRKENGITLSQRVYRDSVLSSGSVERVLNTGLALGKSAREIAKDVEKFISPDVPGGPPAAAMRLARTELNNAFHQTSKKQYIDNPFTVAVKWHLSGSHPRPDECNQYADNSHYRGGEAGVFKPEEVPGKPHPNCLCYTTGVQEDEEAFLRGLNSGKYDKFMDKQGCGFSG